MEKISITIANLQLTAELSQTPTARRISGALPLEGEVNVWGDELYFTIPLQLDLEPEAVEEVAVGTLGYWPSGPAFCIFFGPTPVSTGQLPRAYSPVNVFGRIIGDATQLRAVPDGARIRVSGSAD